MRIKELLTKSFKTAWEYKIIWLFGILLTTLSGPLKAGLNFSYGLIGPGRDVAALPGQTLNWIWVGDQHLRFYLIIAAILVSLHALISILLYPFLSGSMIGLIAGDSEIGKPKARTSLTVGLRKSHLILGESLILVVPYLIAVFIVVTTGAVMMSLSFLSKSTVTSRALMLAITFASVAVISLVAAGIRVSILNYLAQRYIIIDNASAIASIKRAALLFKNHFGQTLLAWLILITVWVGVSIASFMFMVISGILVVHMAAKSLFAGIFVASTALVLVIIFSGFSKAFSSAFWTYFFMALQKRDKVRELSIGNNGEGTYIDEELMCPEIQVNSTSAQPRSEISRI